MRTIAVVLFSLAQGACGRFAFDPVDPRATPTDPYSAAVLDDSPAAYWRLDESSGIVALDETGTHPGTYLGSCQLGVAGITAGGDSAVRFDGASCRIQIGDAFSFANQARFSIELWANPDTVDGSVRWLVSRDTVSGPHTGYQLPFQDVELWFERLVDDAGVTYVGTGSPPATNRFQYFVFTFDGTTQRLFVNATEVNSNSFPVAVADTAGTLVLGDSARGNLKKFSGTLDEVAVYDHALSVAAITAHFAAK